MVLASTRNELLKSTFTTPKKWWPVRVKDKYWQIDALRQESASWSPNLLLGREPRVLHEMTTEGSDRSWCGVAGASENL